ncbi:alkaline phytoceramidase [Massilia violaceinigra]|uniref:Alkaline phytoceramidase n=1 Tax=Massilia violaceinigra TaxID=2045208 RepID=A0A2D2DQQ6_9BURK|nr:alkaline phytoceramidase [Massilia violaceinigra]ATQ77315.1 alkaline phytoceramidase [Massilia violaceinigra]
MQLAHARPNIALYVAAFLAAAMLLAGPILQPAGYHAFADERPLSGLANAADVLSNLGFLVIGLFGLLHVRPARAAHTMFFVAIVLTGVGSSWYHLAPDDTRLIWDRLPIALACVSLLAAALDDAFPARFAPLPTLAVLCGLGAASVFWWSATGNLGPYLLIQLAPLVLVPLLQWQTGAAPAQRRAFGVAIGLYVLAKLCELADGAILNAIHAVSGHTLKHLLAALAALVLTRMIAARH